MKKCATAMEYACESGAFRWVRQPNGATPVLVWKQISPLFCDAWLKQYRKERKRMKRERMLSV